MKPEGEDDRKKGFAEQLSDMRASCFAFLYSKNEEGHAVIMGRTGPSWGRYSCSRITTEYEMFLSERIVIRHNIDCDQ